MTNANRQRLLLLPVLLLATALPLGYFQQSLWRDEASSVWFARLPVTMLLTALCDPHPPGYYLLLKGWLTVGQSEFWLRLPSLFGAVLAAALTYRLGHKLSGPRCGWLAALLLAVHPLQSWYAAEVRMYALVQVGGLLLVGAGLPLLAPTKPANWPQMIRYWLAAVIAVGLDYAALLPLLGLQWLWVQQGRAQSYRWLGLNIAALVSVGLLWLTEYQLYAISHSYWPVLLAVQFQRLGVSLAPADLGFGLLLAAGGAAVGLAGLAWRRVQPATWGWLWLGIWLLLLALSALPRGYTIKRQLMIVLPYLALLSAHALARRPQAVGVTVAGLGLAVSLLFLSGHHREPWRTVVKQITAAAAGGSVVWVDDLAVPVFEYYLRQQQPAGSLSTLRWQPLVGHQLPQLPALEPSPGGTLWLVTADDDYRRLAAHLPPDFQQRYTLVDVTHYAKIGLYRYLQAPPAETTPIMPVRPADAWGIQLRSPVALCRTAGQ